MSMLDRLGLCKLFISYDEALACKSSRFSLGCSLPLVPKWAEYNVRSFSAQSTYMYMNRLSQLQFTKFVSHWNTVVAADFCAKFNKLQSCSSKMLYLLEKKCKNCTKIILCLLTLFTAQSSTVRSSTLATRCFYWAHSVHGCTFEFWWREWSFSRVWLNTAN